MLYYFYNFIVLKVNRKTDYKVLLQSVTSKYLNKTYFLLDICNKYLITNNNWQLLSVIKYVARETI